VTISDKDLDRWEKLASGATPGPWGREDSDNQSTMVTAGYEDDGAHRYVCDAGWADDDRDVVFIAAARDAVPALCAEVRRLRRAVDERFGCRDCVRGDGASVIDELVTERNSLRHERDALRAEVERMKDAWKALSDAARCDELRPEHHGKAVIRFVNDTMGQAAKVFEESRTLRIEVEKMRPIVEAARSWRIVSTAYAVNRLADAVDDLEST
jgi:hypothetical protein